MIFLLNKISTLFCVFFVINDSTVRAGKEKVHDGCGYRNKRGAGNQVSGAKSGEAQFGEFPWMLSIFKESSSDYNNLLCGASLIHPRVVLTAAHCVFNKTDVNFTVRAGGWDLELVVEILPYQDREVKDIIIHPEYLPQALYNDVALLILKEPFDLDEHINVVCLPPQNHEITSERGFSTGWGRSKTDQGIEDRPIILKKIEVPAVTVEECEEKLRKTRLGATFRLHPSFVCAGGEKGKDTCKGDGGGPLVFPVRSGGTDRYFQGGIVAWGIECWEENPGVYVNVAYFRNWIDDQMKINDLDTAEYQYSSFLM